MPIKLEQGINNCQVIYDTRNNDLAGLAAVLRFVSQQNQLLQKVVILTDLSQPGLAPSSLYDQAAKLLHNQGVSKLIGIGQAVASHAAYFQSLETHFFKDLPAFLQSNLLASLQGSLVVVKNAPSTDMASIAKQLFKKCHNTVLEVDLGAIAHNLHFFRSKIACHTKVMVMVKAFAYGSSNCEVAQLLQHAKVDYLAVTYADEGVNLREHGITVPIMVMNPMPASFHRLISYQLEPVLYSLELLASLREFLTKQQAHLSAHIKLETGMNRLGFGIQDIDQLVHILQNTPSIHIQSMMSHLAAAGMPQHDAYTHQQAQLFQQLAHDIEQKLGIKVLKHLLNTAGMLRFPAYQFDMVRLGIGLYGVGVNEKVQPALQIASHLKTTISQIKQISQGATIGYARKGLAHGPKKVATLAIGYADGFSKAFGNGQGKVWINGQLAPVLGEVCMDMCMVDVSHIPAQQGDEVVIFGKEYAIAQVAKSAHTIAYEILTNVSERVKRIYYTD